MNILIHIRIIILTFVLIYQVNCHAENFSDQKSRLVETLELLQKKFTYSTKYTKEVQDNKFIFSEVDSILDHVIANHSNDHELIIPCIRLLYIEANHYIYGDRPVLAQKKLLLAQKLCEKLAGPFEKMEPQKICQNLAVVDKRLPSMYAIILHLLSKSYVYPWDQQNRLQWDEGKQLLTLAIQIRNYIDMHPEMYDDHIDNPAIGNTHIFKRLFGFIFLEEGELQKAEQIFLELMNVDDDYNQLLCLKNLIRVYQKQGQQTQNPLKKRKLYQKAIEYSYQILKLMELETFDDLHRSSIYYSIIGDLYLDSENPFKDLSLAQKFFNIGKQNIDSSNLKSLTFLVHNGLSKTYSELANIETNNAKTEEWEYSEISSKDFLKEINNKAERSITAYEELGDIYRAKKEFIIASTLYSNGLSLIKEVRFPELEKRLSVKMEQVEKEFFPSLMSIGVDYSKVIDGYKNRLVQLRKETAAQIDVRSIEEVYFFITTQYKELINDILRDLLGQMPSLPCSFALICGGSTGWNIATPYSDIELAFLIADETVENRQYFKNLAYLLTLRLISLGETPIAYIHPSITPWLSVENSPSPKGFMLDAPQLSPFRFLIGTPQTIASQLYQGEASTKSNIKLSFLKFDFVSGNHELAKTYENELSRNFISDDRSKISKELLMRDLTRWELKSYFDKSGQRYSVKHDLYRSFDTVLYDIAIKFWTRSAKNPWELVRMLQNENVFEPKLAKNALSIFDEIGKLRIKAYLHAKQQREWLTTSQNVAGEDFLVDESVLLDAFNFVAAFQEHAKTLEPATHQFETGIASAGIVQLAFLQFDKAEDKFRKALLENPDNFNARKNLGILLMTLQRAQEAKETFEILLKQAKSLLELADAYHQLGVVELQLNNSRTALAHLEHSLELQKLVFDEEDPILSDTYIDLGLALVFLQQRQKGIDCILKRVEIDSKFYGSVHPVVARNFFRLGHALLNSGNYHEAKLYLEKAIQIDSIMYGSRHVRSANYYRELGIVLIHLSDPIKAGEFFKLAREIDSQFFGREHPITNHDDQLLSYANTLPLVFEDVTKSTLHDQYKEQELAEAYIKTHPVYKAQTLFKLGQNALLLGNGKEAISYFELSELVKASYFLAKKP